MRHFFHRIDVYIHKYPARITGYLSAIGVNAEKYWQKLPLGLIVPFAMLLIMMGEGSQRMEDKKTIQALYTNNDGSKKDSEIVDEMMDKIL
jgi:hypothetical protein